MVFCNEDILDDPNDGKGHNPYFNRWFSAIKDTIYEWASIIVSQSLF